MSLIEKAVERLERLKQAAGDTAEQYDDGSVPVASGKADAAGADSKGLDAQVVPPSDIKPLSLPPDRPGAVATASSEQVYPAPELKADALSSASADYAPPPSVAGNGGGRWVDIDLERLAAMHMVTPDRSNSRVAEQFRVIKRPLIENAKGLGAAPVRDGNLIMVTSSLPGEGKSFTAINLAMSMAMELDFTVLLVDADFSKPSIFRYLGLPPKRGLMDVLTGEVDDLGEVMLRTSVEKLTLLPAGFSHPRATELIASEAMGRMLTELSKRYPDRIVVFDSPPLIPTTEARVLATRVGQIVMVVEADRTSQGAVKAALATIESCPVKLMMLNKTVVQASNDFYGYGGYGYGYGADADAKSEAFS